MFARSYHQPTANTRKINCIPVSCCKNYFEYHVVKNRPIYAPENIHTASFFFSLSYVFAELPGSFGSYAWFALLAKSKLINNFLIFFEGLSGEIYASCKKT